MSWDGKGLRTVICLIPPSRQDSKCFSPATNVRYQQNLSTRKLAVVILSTNHWPSVREVADKVAIKIDFVQIGQLVRIDINSL